jgi:two-component system chemotaxis response regulator CheB
MTSSSIIVIGASAGGVGALRALAAGLTPPLPAPILVVLHLGAQRSQLPSLLNSCGPTPASHGEDGVLVEPGHIYVAPPDRHMIVVGGRLRLTRGPKENWARPSIDPLFRSAADSYGARAIGVILTGNLDDGTAGLYEIKRRGGIAIAQAPSDAAHPDMPISAASHVDLDYCLPLVEIPRLLRKLVTEEDRAVADLPPRTGPRRGHDTVNGETFERPITITCPDCGGALRRSEMGSLVKYSCHIGHTYTAEAMAAAQFDDMEKVMRSAERILNERAEFCRQMAERLAVSGDPADSALWRAAGGEAVERAYALRDFIEQDWLVPNAAPGVAADA